MMWLSHAVTPMTPMTDDKMTLRILSYGAALRAHPAAGSGTAITEVFRADNSVPMSFIHTTFLWRGTL